MKKNAVSSKLFIISISNVIFFCVIGIGYSKWNGGIELGSLLSTGEVRVVFDGYSCEILEETYTLPEKPADAKTEEAQMTDTETEGSQTEGLQIEASQIEGPQIEGPQISHYGKSLDVYIENACPGYSAEIKYRIVNKGDIPVYCKLITGTESLGLIELERPTEILEANGGSCVGTFKITVPEDIEESANYNLALSLDYAQYNEIG